MFSLEIYHLFHSLSSLLSTGSHGLWIEGFLIRGRQSLIRPDQQGFHDTALGFSSISIPRQYYWQPRCFHSRATFSYFGVYDA